MNSIIERLALGTAAASAITGGALFAFSSFVMPGLRTLSADTALSAMQAINLAAPRSLLLVPLLGSALGSAVVGGYALISGAQPGRGWLLVGAVTGLASMAITAIYHVPHNNALASVASTDSTAGAAWSAYAAGWTAWNHVRTAAALISAAALVIATRAQP